MERKHGIIRRNARGVESRYKLCDYLGSLEARNRCIGIVSRDVYGLRSIRTSGSVERMWREEPNFDLLPNVDMIGHKCTHKDPDYQFCSANVTCGTRL